ncbi:MAG TPA: rubrerythrin family protein [Candidatus Paceibacterota bacterium]|nr:rubrerythrin family protein [Candidatus Paceibacterota bacterium]
MKKLILSLIGVSLVAIGAAQAAVSPQTIENLNAAFQGESNAAHRYAAFATKADAEGHSYAARLFRAAAKAETIHRDTHKKAILKLGGTIKDFKLDEVNVGTTAENLQAAIKGESYERDTMYPEFLKLAKLDGAKPAIRTFIYAQKAEEGHAKLYQDALDNLGKNVDRPVYVCRECGYTITESPTKNCASCRESASKFELIK